MHYSKWAEYSVTVFQSMSSSTKAMGKGGSKGQLQKAAGKDDWQHVVVSKKVQAFAQDIGSQPHIRQQLYRQPQQVQCSAVQCSAVQCAALCYSVLRCAVLCYAVMCSARSAGKQQ